MRRLISIGAVSRAIWRQYPFGKLRPGYLRCLGVCAVVSRLPLSFLEQYKALFLVFCVSHSVTITLSSIFLSITCSLPTLSTSRIIYRSCPEGINIPRTPNHYSTSECTYWEQTIWVLSVNRTLISTAIQS